MTTQTLFSNKKSGADMSMKYFLGELKRSWPRSVLYFIIFFMTMAIPLLISAPYKPYRGIDVSDAEYIFKCSERLFDYVNGVLPFWSAFSMIVALFSGCYVAKILNNKVSADFYHSIPLRRENLFFTRFSVGAISYLVTFFVNVLIFLFICEIQELSAPFYGAIASEIFKSFGFSVLGFFFVYSSCIFAGMLSGTTIMQLVVTAYLNFFPVVAYLSLTATFFLGASHINQSYYVSEDIIPSMVPPIKIMIIPLLEKISALDIIAYIFISLVFIGFSVVIYKARKIERAGTPIVFDGFGAFFKYSMMTIAVLLGGLFFEAISGSFVWYLLGILIGALLSFMLINTILAKNARKMFAGAKSFAIYLVITVAAVLLVAFDAFGIDRYVPDANAVDSVTVTYRNQVYEIKFEDENVIRSVVDIDKKSVNNELVGDGYSAEIYSLSGVKISYAEKDIDIKEEAFYPHYTRSYRLNVVYKLKSGLPLARTVYGEDYESLCILLEKIADSEEFEEGIKKALFDVEYDDYYIEQGIEGNSKYSDFESKNEGFKRPTYALDTIKNEFNGVDYDFYQRQILGYVNFYHYGDDYRNLEYPIFVGTALQAAVTDENDINAFYEDFAGLIEYIVIVKGGNIDYFTAAGDASLVITDKEQIKEILSNAASLTNQLTPFTKAEPLYHIGIKYSTDGDYFNTMTTYFRYGCVPSFVSSAFN